MSSLPKVSTIQWCLAIFSLLVAFSGYFISDYNNLALLALALVLLNLALVGQAIAELIENRLPGKFILVATTFFFFWVGAIDAAGQEVPFSVPRGLPIPSQQYYIEHIQLAFVYITLFQVALLFGYSLHLRVRKLVGICSARHDSSSHRARALRYVLAACALIPFLISYDLNIGNIITALIASRSEINIETKDIGLVSYLLFFGMFGAALFLVEALVIRSIGKFRNLLIGGITVLPFISGGSRHLWLYISFPACVLIFRRLRGKLTISRVLRLCVIPLIILIVMQAQYAFRTLGWSEVQTFSKESLTDTDVTGQFTALLFAEYLVPDTHDYFMEPVEPYFIIHWIPRQFWPEKPIMETWSYYNDAYIQGGAFNVTPSIIGQFHLNWGIYGVVFIGVWLGILTSIADRLLLAINVEKQRAMAVVIGMFYAFIISSFRFYSPIYFAYLIFSVIAMWSVTSRNLPVDKLDDERSGLTVPKGALTPHIYRVD